jgi:hypothetical protein
MDDRIIATLLERHNSDDVFISDDSAPRLKARKRGIPTTEIEAKKLDPPRSDAEKELERVKQQLTSYMDKTPALSVSMTSAKLENDLPTFTIAITKPLSDPEIESLIGKRKRELEINFDTGTMAMMRALYDIQGYKADVTSHLDDYKSYLVEKNQYDQQMLGIIETTFD